MKKNKDLINGEHIHISVIYEFLNKKGKYKKLIITVEGYSKIFLFSKVIYKIKENIKFIYKTGSLIPTTILISSEKDDSLETDLIKYIRDNVELNLLMDKLEKKKLGA